MRPTTRCGSPAPTRSTRSTRPRRSAPADGEHPDGFTGGITDDGSTVVARRESRRRQGRATVAAAAAVPPGPDPSSAAVPPPLPVAFGAGDLPGAVARAGHRGAGGTCAARSAGGDRHGRRRRRAAATQSAGHPGGRRCGSRSRGRRGSRPDRAAGNRLRRAPLV